MITAEEAANEVKFIEAHPELIEGSPPRAKLGEKHEIVQLPEGGCERHSTKIPVPCPTVFPSSSDLPHGEIPFSPPGHVPEGQFEYLRDQRGRPLGVEGWWTAQGATREEAAQRAVSGPYNVLAPRSTHAAHLAGRQGGGRGDAVNLVPVLHEINHPQMSVLENSLTKRVKAGEHLYIQVRVSYRGTGSMPHEITYRVYQPRGDALVLMEQVTFGGEAPAHIH